MFLRKYSNAATFCQERKAPLEADEQPIRKSDEKVDVYARPDQPCREARKPSEPQIRHGISSAHDCELTLIPIPERLGLWATGETAPNDIGNVPAFLDCGLSYAGHQHRRTRLDAE